MFALILIDSKVGWLMWTQLRILLVFSLIFSLPLARASDDAVPQIWQMLDYLATDYASAVEDGVIIDEGEYTEMVDFSAIIHERLQSLSEHQDKLQLIQQADGLKVLVVDKAASSQVAKQAHELADALLVAYPMPTSPQTLPDVAKGASLYQTHCAACHGVTGDADGPLAEGLDPPAIAFTDSDRADQRSPLSLYQTITQGVEDTSMLSFKNALSDNDRWALAYYVGTMAYSAAIEQGKQRWHSDSLARAQISNIDELSRARVDQLDSVLGLQEAQQVIGYLRANPSELEDALTGLALARGRLVASVNAYQNDDRKTAVQLALSAYLDGVEPVEPLLNAHNRELRAQIELSMGAFRTSLNKADNLASVQEQARLIDGLLIEADKYTGTEYRDGTTIFLGALTILLREGLEALLVLVAIFAFLNKSGQRQAKVYVHAGWVSALLAGVATWAVARYLTEISGASRELTEGISALFAAAMLLSVGLWMHNKSVGDRWQAYITDKVSQALNKKSAGLLFLLAFVTVYREVFETILFYAALWTEGQEQALIAGVVLGSIGLVVLAWLMLKTSNKLPIATFFNASSILIAILVFVMVGKGISALQEAGVVDVTRVNAPHIELLGVFPTQETLLAQAITVVVLIAGFWFNKRSR